MSMPETSTFTFSVSPDFKKRALLCSLPMGPLFGVAVFLAGVPPEAFESLQNRIVVVTLAVAGVAGLLMGTVVSFVIYTTMRRIMARSRAQLDEESLTVSGVAKTELKWDQVKEVQMLYDEDDTLLSIRLKPAKGKPIHVSLWESMDEIADRIRALVPENTPFSTGPAGFWNRGRPRSAYLKILGFYAAMALLLVSALFPELVFTDPTVRAVVEVALSLLCFAVGAFSLLLGCAALCGSERANRILESQFAFAPGGRRTQLFYVLFIGLSGLAAAFTPM